MVGTGEAPSAKGRAPIEVRAMTGDDVAVADRVMRRAFGVHLGLADPERTFGAASYTATRFAISPEGSFVAVLDGQVVGSVHATTWGSVGFVGPLTVREDLWDRGVARRLLAPVVEHFDRRGVAFSALFTFAQSAKHVALYQRFGYWPQHLTAIMSRPVAPDGASGAARRYSLLDGAARAEALAGCARLADRVFTGLDLSIEIARAHEHGFGETVIVDDDAGVAAFAVCHVGAGEADTGVCYVKFAAARPGPAARDLLERLLEGVDALARERGAAQVVAGVDTARRGAYRDLLERGFRAGGQGIRMHRPDGPGYARADAFVLDDLR